MTERERYEAEVRSIMKTVGGEKPKKEPKKAAEAPKKAAEEPKKEAKGAKK